MNMHTNRRNYEAALLDRAAPVVRKPRRKRAQPEAQLQGAVVEYLRKSLPARAIVFHTPNGGGRDKREAARLKWQGVLPGIPDVIAMLDGRVFGLELKAPKGVVSPEQAAIGDRFTENGFPWTVARSLDDVERFLAGHDVPLKAKLA